jgi:hypothetical protein
MLRSNLPSSRTVVSGETPWPYGSLGSVARTNVGLGGDKACDPDDRRPICAAGCSDLIVSGEEPGEGLETLPLLLEFASSHDLARALTDLVDCRTRPDSK